MQPIVIQIHFEPRRFRIKHESMVRVNKPLSKTLLQHCVYPSQFIKCELGISLTWQDGGRDDDAVCIDIEDHVAQLQV